MLLGNEAMLEVDAVVVLVEVMMVEVMMVLIYFGLMLSLLKLAWLGFDPPLV